MAENLLCLGDNLKVLQEHVGTETVDLIYLDPPFNSNQTYNVLFKEHDGTRAAAQIKAFTDTWEWDEGSEYSYVLTVETGPPALAQLLRSLRAFLGTSNLMAYLAMMAPRLIELHRVLKPTGSLYLHCDPTASHYLKLLLDGLFAPQRFRNEIIWKRSSAHSDSKQGMKQPGRVHDTILFYTKSDRWTWNTIYLPYDEEYVKSHYSYVEEGTGRRFTTSDLTAAKPGGDTLYEWHGRHPPKNRFWAYSIGNMRKFEESGRLHYGRSGIPRYKRYLDEMPGVPLQDLWTDISPINSQAAERLGYPTQKPVTLLERIIASSSNIGDVVLDPFCGCGTTVAAAQKLERRWIGIDITHIALGIIKARLFSDYGDGVEYTTRFEPEEATDARELARTDPHQFEYWALGLVGAQRAVHHRGPDKGVDGRMYLRDGQGGHYQILFSVKSGRLKPDDIRALGHVVNRENAEMGVLITMNPPSQQMRADAASAGLHDTPWGRFPRLQIITIEELLQGKKLQRPYLRFVHEVVEKPPRRTTADAAPLLLPL
jgi:DNA modification methylase